MTRRCDQCLVAGKPCVECRLSELEALVGSREDEACAKCGQRVGAAANACTIADCPQWSPPQSLPWGLFSGLGDALRALRGERSQAEMAALFGRTQAWWSYIESGNRNPRLDDLQQISHKLGLSLADGVWRLPGAQLPYARNDDGALI